MDIDFVDLILLNYTTYRDYLNSFLRIEDVFYLPHSHVCEMIVKLGNRSVQNVYSEDEFYKHKALVFEFTNPKISSWVLFSDYLKSQDPVLMALKEREGPAQKKVLSTIIFLKHRTKGGFELSSYIDFGYSVRLRNLEMKGSTDWQAVFEGRIKLIPKKEHLSYWDIHNKIVLYNESDNFRVIHDTSYGLLFIHRGDHKVIATGPEKTIYSKNSTRTVVYSPIYDYVVFYDHLVRKKN